MWTKTFSTTVVNSAKTEKNSQQKYQCAEMYRSIDLSSLFRETVNRLMVKVNSTCALSFFFLVVQKVGEGARTYKRRCDIARYHSIQSSLSTNVKVIFGVTLCSNIARVNVMSKLKCPICDFQSFG